MKKNIFFFLIFSLFSLSAFEVPGKWIIEKHNGCIGKGTIVNTDARSGKHSYKLQKDNALGWISIRSSKPIAVKAGVKYALGGWFQTQTSDLQSLLLFRVTRSKDEIPKYDTIDRSNGIFTQSVLVNSPKGQWKRRVVHFQSNKNEKVYLHCILFGNPAEVLLDDITFAPAKFNIKRMPFEERFNYPFSTEQVYETLLKRPSNSMEVKNGKLYLNGKFVQPVFYKQENRRPEQNRYEEFYSSGVPFAIATIFITQIYEQRGVILPNGKIDFKRVDELLLRALRRNPNLNLIVEFVILEPYPGWGDKYPNEVWQNEKKEKAYTTWGNIQGYTKSIKKLAPPKHKEAKYCYMPSYSSEIFQQNISSYLDKIVKHINASPLGRSVAGFHLGGGHDHQFQYAKPDYSLAALKAWRKFCKNPNASIPKINRTQENGSAFVNNDNTSRLYWEFRENQAWKVKNTFATAIKKASKKSVTVSAYLGAPENYMPEPKAMSNIDIVITITPYAFRKSSYPIGGSIPEESYALHNKIFLSELDLRCWNYVTPDEVRDHYISVSRTFPEWKNVHRKLTGMLIAKNSAWWYYTMYHYFDDLRIMQDISKTVKIAQEVSALPENSNFKPGLCLVRSKSNDSDAAAEYSISKDVKMYPLARSVFERSGVPFVTHYLSDILRNKDLQNYSMYVFLHNTRLSIAEKNAISQKLKNKRRILVWLYGTGVLNERGLDIDGMRNLTSFELLLQQGNVRRTPIFTNHKLVEHLPPMPGMGELRYGIFSLLGKSPHMARGQEFLIKEDEGIECLARYVENSKPAIVMRNLGDWTSVYSSAPWGITPELLNRLAKLNNTYTVANPGQSIFMNSRFISIHCLKSEKNFTINLPKGTKKAIFADNGKNIAIQNSKIKINIIAGNTYWIILQ